MVPGAMIPNKNQPLLFYARQSSGLVLFIKVVAEHLSASPLHLFIRIALA
jgi:hypothetical protein